ncbi:MAG TPA: glycosyltransferase family 39 protein [bacterium]|nr:glycosyltransferase family 39 protein [bacterium]
MANRRSRKAKKHEAPKGRARSAFSLQKFGAILLAWAAILAGLLSLPNYNLLLRPGNAFIHNQIQVFPKDNLFAHLPGVPLIVIGFIALVVLFRQAPLFPESEGDLSPLAARIGFWAFLALGGYLRWESPHQPVGFYWDDHYTITADIRNMLDFHKFFFLFPVGWREPFFPYLSAFLWLFDPRATGLIVVLLADILIDLGALWLFYLIGKEIGGRRMGLVLLAMGSICKTMVMVTKFEYGNDTAVLASAAVVLFFLRLLKKPDLSHFIQWGAALGAGAFAYVPFRPWTPVFLGAAFLWLFHDPKERKVDPYRIVLGPALLAAWAFLFVYKNSFLPEQNGLVRLVAGPGAVLFALLLAFSYAKVAMRERRKGFSKLFGWATGAILTALIMAPFYLHPHYSEHVADISAFSSKFTEPGKGWQKVWENNLFTWKLLFGQVDHVSRLPAIGDSLYEYMVAGCALLGLASFVARPQWVTAFIVSLFFVSTTAGTLSNGPHSFRYVICDLPLLLTGAWGVNRLWNVFRRTRHPQWMKPVLAGVLFLGFVWETIQDHKLTWEWMAQEAQNTIVWTHARSEMPDHRVYIVEHNPGFYAACAMEVLADGSDLFQATDSNSIDLTPDEKGKDLAIFVWGRDTGTQKRIEQEFPGVVWNKKTYYLQGDDDVPYLWWTRVPFDRIPADPKAYFHVRRVPSTTWRRRCYGYYGLGRGLILYEDRVAHWNDDLPDHRFIDWNNSMRVEGNWEAPESGKYHFSLRTGNVMRFFIDGRKVLEMEPDHSGVRACDLELSRGPHSIEVVTAFASEHQVPMVHVTLPGGSQEMPLDQMTANVGH